MRHLGIVLLLVASLAACKKDKAEEAKPAESAGQVAAVPAAPPAPALPIATPPAAVVETPTPAVVVPPPAPPAPPPAPPVAAAPVAKPTPGVPVRAMQYQRGLIRNARNVWGMTAPVAVFAAQLHQESGWRADVSSPYAHGLAQFTPDTARWIAGAYPDELAFGEMGDKAPFNPDWALRAVVRYDRYLYDRLPSATECDRWAFTLASYNGGHGWVLRDKKLAQQNGLDPSRWWGNVERFSTRAKWAFDENRGYPKRILLLIQPTYMPWGPGVSCAGVG